MCTSWLVAAVEVGAACCCCPVVEGAAQKTAHTVLSSPSLPLRSPPFFKTRTTVLLEIFTGWRGRQRDPGGHEGKS